jgi:hypothetical protein
MPSLIPGCCTQTSTPFLGIDAPGSSVAPATSGDASLQSRNGPAETISLCFQFRNDGDGVHDPPFGFGGCHCRSTGFKSAYQLLDLWTPLSRVPNMLPVFASIHKRKS